LCFSFIPAACALFPFLRIVLKKMGFAAVGYPLTGIYSAAGATEEAFAHLLKK
jgi:hypothetical protein